MIKLWNIYNVMGLFLYYYESIKGIIILVSCLLLYSKFYDVNILSFSNLVFGRYFKLCIRCI